MTRVLSSNGSQGSQGSEAAAFLASEGTRVLDSEVANLDGTEDGETGKQAHCSSDDGYLSLQSVLRVFLDEVKSGRVEINANHFQLKFESFSWIIKNNWVKGIQFW